MVTPDEKENWLLNIDCLASEAADIHGNKTVQGVFAMYNATCSNNLSEACLESVFSELQLLVSD